MGTKLNFKTSNDKTFILFQIMYVKFTIFFRDIFKYNKKSSNIYVNDKISLKLKMDFHTILLSCINILPIFSGLTILSSRTLKMFA